jgi:hypothetical protein
MYKLMKKIFQPLSVTLFHILYKYNTRMEFDQSNKNRRVCIAFNINIIYFCQTNVHVIKQFNSDDQFKGVYSL